MQPYDKWVPVNMAWSVLRLWMMEWPAIWTVEANILYNHSRTADKWWSSSYELAEMLKTPHR